jgi:hypothetical protein
MFPFVTEIIMILYDLRTSAETSTLTDVNINVRKMLHSCEID